MQNKIFKITEKDDLFNRKVKSYAESLYSPLNTLLLIHGNCVFIKGNFAAKTFIYVALYIYIFISEVANINNLYHDIKYNNNGNKSKRNIVYAVVFAVNELVRIFFFTRRRKLESTFRRLAKIYSILSNETKNLATFKKKLIFIMVFYHIFTAVQIAFLGYIDGDTVGTTPTFGAMPPPLAVPCHIMAFFSIIWVYLELAIPCYFCSMCFLLKETLLALKKELLHNNIKMDTFFEFYSEIIGLMSEIIDICQPILLTGLAVILIRVFSNTYTGVFVGHGFYSMYYLLRGVFMFSNLIVVCIFGTSVINTGLAVKKAAQNKITNFAKPKTFYRFLQMNETFVGFKLLNSIPIDLSFVLSSIGSLLSYGILIATFNISSSSVAQN